MDLTPEEKDREVRPFAELRESGLLWLINRVVFHPRGYALALHVRGGEAVGWRLLGDGCEVWRFEDPEDDRFSQAQKTLASETSAYQAGREDAARAAESVFPTSTDTMRAFLARHRLSDTPSVGAVSVALLADVRGSTSLGRSAGGVGDNPEEQRP